MTKQLANYKQLKHSTVTKIYDQVITTVGKTYTITVKGIYMAWGTSSQTTGNPAVIITMGGVIKAKIVGTASGTWAGFSTMAVAELNVGDTIVVAQEGASAADNRSSVGMCLIQETT